MAWVITLLREMLNDEDSGDYTWTDDELETRLDMPEARTDIRREKLSRSADKKTFYSNFARLEGDEATWDGDPTIALWDGTGSSATEITPNSWNLQAGTFTFTTAQDDIYYLDAKSYNLHGVIAECLEQLAMNPNKARGWSRGGVSYSHYDLMVMARYHRRLSGMKKGRIVRSYGV
jgi:hypothetical protein